MSTVAVVLFSGGYNNDLSPDLYVRIRFLAADNALKIWFQI